MIKRQTNKTYKRPDKRDKYSGESTDEETELITQSKSPKREIPTIEKNIDEEDTLQSLAIRYHCTIEDLKRLNNIHKENEIFARRTIKVPHRPFTEALVGIHISGRTSPDEPTEPQTSKLIDINSLDDSLQQIDENEVNQIIFNSSISNKDYNREENVVYESEENTSLLTQNYLFQKPEPIISKLNCNGSDWDISYPALIVCIVLVIFAIPLIYVFYIAEHLEIYLNHTHSNQS